MTPSGNALHVELRAPTGHRFGHHFRIPMGAVETMADAAQSIEAAETWSELALDSFAADWDNDLDAEYDDWRERYDVPAG